MQLVEAERRDRSLSEQSQRVVNEDRRPYPLFRDESRERVEKLSRVGEPAGVEVPRVGPIASPKKALRRHRHEPVRERHDIGIGLALMGNSVRAADLDLDVVTPGERNQHFKGRIIESMPRVDAAEMIDDNGNGDRRNP